MERRWRRQPWPAAAVLVLSLPAGFLLATVRPPESVVGSSAFVVPVLLSVVVTALAIRGVPAGRRRAWSWVLLGLTMYLAGEILFAVIDINGWESWPTPADVIYLLAYVPMTIGLLGLDRRRNRNRSNLLDACILALSAATLFGVFVIVPAAADDTQPMLARVVSSAYPLADILWIFLLARMLTGPARRTAVFWFLIAGTLTAVTADVTLTVLQFAQGGDAVPDWMAWLWMSLYACFALAACCDTLPQPAEHAPVAGRGLTVARLVLLGVAAVLPSLVLLVLAAAGRDVPDAALALGSVILVGLVVTRIWDLLQQVQAQSALLAELARTDALTGAANRRTWDHEIERACARSTRLGIGLYVALLDLDHFKNYNDTHGHQAGDELLKSAAAAWSEELGETGFIARWGGEEFAVLLHSGDDATALARVDRLRGRVPHDQTCSIGAARWDGEEQPGSLLRRADEALYRAKAGGRDRLAAAPELAARLTSSA